MTPDPDLNPNPNPNPNQVNRLLEGGGVNPNWSDERGVSGLALAASNG